MTNSSRLRPVGDRTSRLDLGRSRAYNSNVTLKNRPCAVLAEDEPAILMALDEVLSSEGFTTVPCTDGLSALEAIRSKQPTLAVFDVNMPRLSGTELTLRLRMVDVMNELRILMITGRDDLRTRRAILSSGADDFIIKPFDLKSFLEAIHRLLEEPPMGWLWRDSWYALTSDSELGLQAFPPPSSPGDTDQAFASLLSRLARSFDERSLHQPYHLIQVAHLSQMMARAMGFGATEAARVRTAGLVHDLGLLLIPDAVVNMPGPLDKEARTRLRQHPAAGAEILAASPELEPIVPAVLHHHERWDGTGYPDGLAAEAIPIEARILTVADAFSAMTTRRSYADSLTMEEASRELDTHAGTQFDPACVKAFHTVAGI